MANQVKPVKFNLNQLNYKYVKRTVLGGIVLMLGLAIYGSHYFTPEATYADTTTTNGTYNGTSYYVTTATSDLNLNLAAKPDGNLTIAKQTATVTTNAPGGYQLYLSTNSTNTNSNRLNLDGSTSATKYLSAASGTYASPAVLTDNSRGYALANVGSFNSSYTEVTSKTMKDYTDTNKFAKVPIQGSEQLIKSTTSANTSGDTTNIYYAAKAKYDTTGSNNLTNGTYYTTVAYTTIANASAADTLTVSPTSGAAGTANTITITTPLMAASGNLTASDITAKIGTSTCSSVSITSTSPLTFTCQTPTNLTAGTTYDVTTTVSKYGKTYTKTSTYTTITDTNFCDTHECMQDKTYANYCNSSTVKATTSVNNAPTYTLYDSRTKEPYYIRKITTSSNVTYCFMVENLYMPGSLTINSGNSNTTSEYVIPISSSEGFSDDTATYIYSYENVSSARHRYGGIYDGSYISWLTAKTGVNSDGGADICPKNWHLPKNTSEYGAISEAVKKIDLKIWYSDASGGLSSPILQGSYTNSVVDGPGDYAGWWTSAQYQTGNAYILYAEEDTLTIGYHGQKRLGAGVRCILSAS